MCSSYLIEEHILPVCPFSRKLLNNPLWADAMLCTQLLPKLKSDCKTDRGADVRNVYVRLIYLAVYEWYITQTVFTTC